MKSTFKKLPHSEVEIAVSVRSEDFQKYHGRAFKKLQDSIEIDGFRKGHVPEDQLVKKFGEMIVLEEMANLCLQEIYIGLLQEHKVTPIAQPKISITKLAKDNPFEATFTIPTLPEITLPSYTKIAKEEAAKVSDEAVTDKDVDDVLIELQKGKAPKHDHHHDHDGHDHHDHAHEHAHDEKEVAELPVLNDEFAQSFGEQFKTLDDLKTKVRENLTLEKKQKTSEKKRSAIMEKIIAETKVDLSDALVENELDRMIGQMKADVGRFGGTWEDYLKHATKTETELRTDWRKDAERRSISQLALYEIAKQEKITPSEEEIDAELIRLKTMMPEADEDRAREYLHQALTNEKVLAFLEKCN
jgi:trigger factor